MHRGVRSGRQPAVVNGPRLSTAHGVLLQHGSDESSYRPLPPDAVVYVHSTDEAAFVVRACARERVPIIAFGVGSSIEGHLLAVEGGVCIDFSQMNEVLAIRTSDLTATVQAGVTRSQLNAALSGTGFFFSVDPGADATVGGMVATSASGTNTVRYGTMRDNLLSLTVVTAEGEVIRTASHARKSSAGYNLTQLFCGSEGTLGLITEATVRIHPHPEVVAAAVVHFPTVRAAVDGVIESIQLGVPLARAEMLDSLTIKAVNAHSYTTLAEKPTLFLEFAGSQAQIEEQAAVVREIAGGHGGGEFQWASLQEERSRLWTPRHHAYFASLQLKPGSRSMTTDACVPLSALGPRAWRRRWPTSRRTACWRRCSAMWAMATSIAWCWSIPIRRTRSRRPRPSATGWSGGRCGTAAPPRASTAWACTRCSTSSRSTGRTRWR